ncbi:MAG: GMC family oxidoreductase [Desulfarculaceae bacterium]|nr:GMC family oxidoreductase [Desulfarculaceae bacterium]
MNAEPYDICVVGTGAGGGILAHTLVQAGMRVISVEQGDALPEDYFTRINPPGNSIDFGLKSDVPLPLDPHGFAFEHQLYSKPEMLSSHPAEPDAFRQFQIFALDGLTNLWNGVSVRLAPGDFTGWPLSYSDLEEHYRAVERIVGVCGTREDLPDIPDGEFMAPKELRPPDRLFRTAAGKVRGYGVRVIPNRKAVETRPEQPNRCQDTGGCISGCPYHSVYKFSSHLLPAIKDSGRFTLRLNSKAVGLEYDALGGEVRGLRVIDPRTGEGDVVRAKAYVLSAGALETPRILFNTANGHSPQGPANSSGLLGQGLQDNPKVLLSTSLWRLWGSRKKYPQGYGDHLLVLAKARTPDGESFPCLGQFVHQLPSIPLYLPWLKKCPPALKPWLAKQLFRSYATLAFFAPADDESGNRVIPSQRTDAFGVPQVEVVYRESAREKAMKQAMLDLGEKLLKKASATVILKEGAAAGLGIHYAGTARMAAGPSQGVVDADLRCFDHPNLYVCDGSVIPKLPEKHLTLTIMALAHRLGRHLAENAPSLYHRPGSA